MATTRIFLSYVPEDTAAFDLLRKQLRDREGGLSFDDHSGMTTSECENHGEAIRAASVVICLVGERTAESPWVNWAIRTASSMGTPIIGIRLRSQADPLPAELTMAPSRIVGRDIDAVLSLISS